ncbi:MAG: BON domain-containing protein [Pyrinomonadaceae bacterium]
MKIKFLSLLTLTCVLFLAACGGKSDSDLQKAASDKLSSDQISGVAVAVKDGTATLTGEVKDVTVKTKAEADVKGIDGIKTVNNNLTLIPLAAAPTPMGNDKMMEGTISENLKKANITGVTVSVNNGEVTLTGEVPKEDFAKVQMAATAANPKGINNQVKRK